jgi:hypothetical protein
MKMTGSETEKEKKKKERKLRYQFTAIFISKASITWSSHHSWITKIHGN